MVQQALTWSIRNILARLSWSRTRSCQADLFVVCFLPSTLMATDSDIISVVMSFTWRSPSGSMSPFYESHWLSASPCLSNALKDSSPSEPPRVQTIPSRTHSPPEGASACLLARLGFRPTHVQWPPFHFFRNLNKEGNIESRWGATWKPGKFLRTIIHIPVSGCQR